VVRTCGMGASRYFTVPKRGSRVAGGSTHSTRLATQRP
jgi:hypothetical protein